MNPMNCSRCGALLAPNSAFCGACGAPAGYGGVVASPPARPTLVTVLAVLQFLGAGVWLLMAIVTLVAVATDDSGQVEPAVVALGLGLGCIAALQVTCGVGLLKLKPYGRTLQLVFAWIGLLGIPIGTLISILILVYLFKPGIKVLFSGRPAPEWTPDERTHVVAVTQGSQLATAILAILVALVAIGGVGIVAAIAVPGLLRARMAGNEASAIGSLRVIQTAQENYAASCAKGYAVTLDDLAKPPAGSARGFITPELGTNGATRSGYSVAISRNAAADVTDVATARETCNASAGNPVSAYFATAEPTTAGATGRRYFATDARGVIYFSMSPIANPIVESADVVPVR
jgi:type IV pilus assembly protein PilA